MKKQIIFCLAIFLFSFSSCTNKDKKINSTEIDKKTDVQAELIVEMIYPYADKFLVFYTTDINADIDGSKVIEKMVFGTQNMQKIVFKFPKGDFPQLIRLDVGKNQNAQNITIKNISIKYGDKIIDGDDGVFMLNWSPNNCLSFNKETLSYNIIPNNGVKDPVFMSNTVIQEELLKMFQ